MERASRCGRGGLERERDRAHHLYEPTSNTLERSSRLLISEKFSIFQVNLPYRSDGMGPVDDTPPRTPSALAASRLTRSDFRRSASCCDVCRTRLYSCEDHPIGAVGTSRRHTTWDRFPRLRRSQRHGTPRVSRTRRAGEWQPEGAVSALPDRDEVFTHWAAVGSRGGPGKSEDIWLCRLRLRITPCGWRDDRERL